MPHGDNMDGGGSAVQAHLAPGATSTSSSQPMDSAELVALVAALRLEPSLAGASGSRKREGAHGKESSEIQPSAAGPSNSSVSGAIGAQDALAVPDTLDLCHRRIESIPDEVVQMLKDDVVRLALGYNLITSLPPTFAQLARLRYLNVRANLLTVFPAVITELPCLEILDISRNKLRALPEVPGRLLHLRVLSISNNRLRRLPPYIAQMRHLKILKIEHNQLTWPPPHVATVPPVTAAEGAMVAAAPPPANTPVADAEGEMAKERERLLQVRRKAEDRTMNAWIKDLQAWIEDQTTTITRSATVEPETIAAQESDVISLPVSQPEAPAPTPPSAPAMVEPQTSADEREAEETAQNTAATTALGEMMLSMGGSHPSSRSTTPASERRPSPPPPAMTEATEPVPPLPLEYSPVASPALDSVGFFKSEERTRQPTLAELADRELAGPLPPLPPPTYGFRGRQHSRNISTSSSTSSTSLSRVRMPKRQKSLEAFESIETLREDVPPWQPALATPAPAPAPAPVNEDADETINERSSHPLNIKKLTNQMGSSLDQTPPPALPARSPERDRGLNGGTALLPSAPLRQPPTGLRKLSLPSTVAAQAAAEAFSTPPSTGTFSVISPDATFARRTPGGGSNIPVLRSSPSHNGHSGSVDVQRNSYFKRLSVMPSASATKSIPTPVLLFIDATRGLLFALSQMHTALKQYIFFTLDDRISMQFNRILEVASGSMGGLIRALDRFDSLSRKGNAEAGTARAVLAACKESVSTFRRVASVLQLQLKPLQQSVDVRYSRTFLLMLYGTIVELSNSWKSMSPHIEAVQPFLQLSEVVVPDQRRNDPVLSPIAETMSQSRSRHKTTSSLNRPQRRRHAGSFSARDVAQGALLNNAAFTAPPNADAFDVADMERSRKRAASGRSRLGSDGTFDRVIYEQDTPLSMRSAEPTRGAFPMRHAYTETPPHTRKESSGLPLSASEQWSTPMSASRTAPLQMQQRQAFAASKHGAGLASPLDGHLLDLVDKVSMTSASVWASLLGQSLDEDIVHFTSRDSQATTPALEPSAPTLGSRLLELRTKATHCDQLTGLLRSTLQECRAVFQKLEGEAAHEESVARLWEESNTLVRIIVQISTLIKGISAEYSFRKELLVSLGALTTTCTELMIHMHFLSPEKTASAQQAASASVGPTGIHTAPIVA